MDSIVQVAQLVLVCEKIEGRVKVQKIVHILQEAGNSGFSQDYGYLHHGPYSSALARELDQLKEGGYIDESEKRVGDYTRHVYQPTEHLRGVGKDLWDESDPPWKELADKLNTKLSNELEAISTIMYLRRKNFTGDRLKDRFSELKPHLKEKFETCLSFAKSRQLVAG